MQCGGFRDDGRESMVKDNVREGGFRDNGKEIRVRDNIRENRV